MTNGDKLELLFKEIFPDFNLNKFQNFEDRMKKVTRELNKIYHPDLYVRHSDEEKEYYLDLFCKVYSDLIDSGEVKRNKYDVINALHKFIEAYDLPYKSEKKIKDDGPKTYDEAVKAAKELWKFELENYDEEDKKKFQKYAGVISLKYKTLEKKLNECNTRDEALQVGAEQIRLCKIFVDRMERCQHSLEQMLELLKKILPKDDSDILGYEDDVEDFKKIICSVKGEKPRITGDKSLNKYYVRVYVPMKKNIVIESFFREMSGLFENKEDYFDKIKNKFYRDVKAVGGLDFEEMKPKDIDDILDKIVAEYKLKFYQFNNNLSSYLELERYVLDRNYKLNDLGFDISCLLDYTDANENQKRYKKLKEKVELKIAQLDAIESLKKECLNFKNSHIDSLLHDYIDKINTCVNVADVEYVRDVAVKKINYVVVVNLEIDKYIAVCSTNSRYSFSIDDMVMITDRMRSYYNPKDQNFELFRNEFNILKSEIEAKVDNDLNRAKTKKENLIARIKDGYDEGVFVDNNYGQYVVLVDAIDKFGKFGDFYNNVVKNNLKNLIEMKLIELSKEFKLQNASKSFENYFYDAQRVLTILLNEIIQAKNISAASVLGMNYVSLSQNIQKLGYEDSQNGFFMQGTVLDYLEKIVKKKENDKKRS